MDGWATQTEAEAAITPAPVEDEAAFIARRNHEIQTWLNGKQAATAATEFERQAREKVAATLFPTPKKGTQRYALANGFAVKLVYTISYTLGDKDKEDGNGMKIPVRKQVEDVLEQISKCGNEGPVLADRLVKWRPELDVKEYEALNPDLAEHVAIKKLIDGILTTKPGAPQLTFEEPKPAT